MLLKHEKMVDVGFYIIKKFYIKEKNAWKWKGTWWRVTGLRPYSMGITETLLVPQDQVSKWKRID